MQLECGTAEQDTAVAQLLRAAAWTYIAAFITSLIFRSLLLSLLGGRRE
jgi:Zn-dependent membrane protease YugP